MKLKDLLDQNLIKKINETKYQCKQCQLIFSKLGITNHYFYMHEKNGIKKRKMLRDKSLKNNNTEKMKLKISEKTKEAFKKESVKHNFIKYVNRMKNERMGEGNPFYGKKHTEEWKNNHSRKIKGFCHSEETKERLKILRIGKKHKLESIKKMSLAKLGKKASLSTKIKMSESHKNNTYSKLTIEKINSKYTFFSQIEEMRYNPDKPEEKESQVHCHNHNCSKSKEKDGWFTPNIEQLKRRIYELEKDDGNGGCYFYCPDGCKQTCPTYGKSVAQLIKEDEIRAGIIKEESPTGELHIFREEVLKRQRDELGYNECEYCRNKNLKELVVHHEYPRKTHPQFELDPDNGIVCCGMNSENKCHYKYGHRKGTPCSTGNLANKICTQVGEI